MAERKNLDANLIQIKETTADGKTKISLENVSTDRMIIMSYTVNNGAGCKVLAGGKDCGGGKFECTLYPGSGVKEVWQGSNFGGWKCGWTTKTPDASFEQDNAQRLLKHSETAIKGFQAVVRAAGKNPDKITSAECAAIAEEYGVTFVDLAFPPQATPSLYRAWEKTSSAGRHSTDFCNRPVPWLRPFMFVPDGKQAQLFVDGISCDDIAQGSIGNCYMVASVVGLAEQPLRLFTLFSGSDSNAAIGSYTMYHCKEGMWTQEVLDEWLPCTATSLRGELIFGKNREEAEEIWYPLVEKLFAKVYGSYKAIEAGCAGQAVQDLSGMPYVDMTELDSWPEKGDALWRELCNFDKQGCVITLSTPSPGSPEVKNHDALGLATGHAYCLLGCHELKSANKRLLLVKNPWASASAEYKGPWGDADTTNWTAARKAEINYDKYNKEADGTFFIEFEAALGAPGKNTTGLFSGGYINHVVDTKFNAVRSRATISGCVPDSVYKITTTTTTRVVASLHQTDRRGQKNKEGFKYVGLRLGIMNARDSSKVAAINGASYWCSRDQSVNAELPPGEWFVVPMTFDPAWNEGKEGSLGFCVFVEANKGASVELYDTGAQAGARGRKGNALSNFAPRDCVPAAAPRTVQVSTPALGFDYMQVEVVPAAYRDDGTGGEIPFANFTQRSQTPALPVADPASVLHAWERLQAAARGQIPSRVGAAAAAANAADPDAYVPPPPAPPPPPQPIAVASLAAPKKKPKLTAEQRQKKRDELGIAAGTGQVVASADADEGGNIAGPVAATVVPRPASAAPGGGSGGAAPAAAAAPAVGTGLRKNNGGAEFVYGTELTAICNTDTDDGILKDFFFALFCPCVASALGRGAIDGKPFAAACCCDMSGQTHAWLRGSGGAVSESAGSEAWLGACCGCLAARRVYTEGRRRNPTGAAVQRAKNGEFQQNFWGCDAPGCLTACVCPCFNVHETRQLLQGSDNAGSCLFNSCCVNPAAIYAEVRHTYGLEAQFLPEALEDTVLPCLCYPCAVNNAVREARVRNGQPFDATTDFTKAVMQ